MTTTEPSIGIFTTDSNLLVTYWDNWLSRATGISGDEAMGQPLISMIPDIQSRGLIDRFRQVLNIGVIEILAPSFHRYLIPCPPQGEFRHFDRMQQRVTIAPLREDDRIMGTLVTLEDVTARIERERDLSEALKSQDETVRIRAAEELAASDSEPAQHLMAAIADESWRVRKIAVDGLARHGSKDTVASLLLSIRDQHKNPSMLNSALQILAMTNLDIIPPLVEFLKDNDPDLRTYSAMVLGDHNDPRTVPPLICALEDSDANVRYQAIESLGKLRALDAVQPLAAIAESGDFFLAFPALDALSRIGSPDVAVRLTPLLENDLLRSPAAEALGQIGNEEIVAPLAAILNQSDAAVPVIAQALAAIYDRYEKAYHEGDYIADLARQTLSPSGAQHLMNCLSEAGSDDLRAIAMVLGWLEGPAIERTLTQLIGQPTARKEVVEALVRYGPRVISLLIEQLESDDFETRQASIFALGRIGGPRSVPYLLRILADDVELAVVAAGALAKIGDRRAFESLLNIMGHPALTVRQAVVGALNSIGHPEMEGEMAKRLLSPDSLIRESAVKVAGYFGYDTCRDLLLACCADTEEQIRKTAIEHIPYLEDNRVLPVIVKALREETPKVRASAARALSQMERKDALPFLLDTLKDPDPWVRYFGVGSIGKLGYPEAMALLTHIVQNDTAGHVRIAAAKAIGRIGGRKAAEILAPMTDHPDTNMAVATITALGQVQHPDAQTAILAALKSPDPDRRIGAVIGMQERSGAAIVSALQWTAATDADVRVVRVAIDALAHLKSPESVTALVSLAASSKLRELTVSALSSMSNDAIEWLADSMNHAHVEVRLAVLDALSRIKTPRATDVLTTALEDSEVRVRLAAASALSHLGSRQAERRLAILAKTDPSPEVRHAAQRALEH
jgi:HEAT repeat protein